MSRTIRQVSRIQEATDEGGAEGFGMANLTPAEQQQAGEMAEVAVSAVLKGVLNRVDPVAYPVKQDPDEIDSRAAALAATLPQPALARMGRRAVALVDSGRTLRVRGKAVDLAAVRKVDTTAVLPASRRLVLRPVLRDDDAQSLPVPSEPKYRRAHLVLRAIHCVRETGGGGADEIIFGGVLIGASGNVSAIEAFDSGDYDTGTYADFGERFIGQYSLRSTAGYPKHLYAIFALVESDSDDAEVAREMTRGISALAGAVIGLFGTAAAGVAAVAAIEAIGGLIQAFFGDDALRPYGIRLSLGSEDQFGGFEGPKQRTGNITGDGAIYRIGYRWLLGA